MFVKVGQAFDMPWRAICELRRLLCLPLIRAQFAVQGIHWGRHWRIYGSPILQIYRKSQIMVGDNFELRSWYCANPLVPNHPVVLATRTALAVIRIGDSCGFTGVTIVAAERIEIGKRVLIGANTIVVDTDFHAVSSQDRQTLHSTGKNAPVIIEDDVFIGMNCLILKGVTIGRGSVIGAGSVVTHDVAPGAIVAGNPARVIASQ